jgi:hypothetical protein
MTFEVGGRLAGTNDHLRGLARPLGAGDGGNGHKATRQE